MFFLHWARNEPSKLCSVFFYWHMEEILVLTLLVFFKIKDRAMFSWKAFSQCLCQGFRHLHKNQAGNYINPTDLKSIVRCYLKKFKASNKKVTSKGKTVTLLNAIVFLTWFDVRQRAFKIFKLKKVSKCFRFGTKSKPIDKLSKPK